LVQILIKFLNYSTTYTGLEAVAGDSYTAASVAGFDAVAADSYTAASVAGLI
jgi:hypothetical protein